FRNYRTRDGNFAFGTLVGRIGSGNFFRIGSSFDGVANASGTLSLFNWDSNTWDNSGDIVAHVSVPTSPVPLPASGLLLLGGFGALGAMRRARRRS
ncbi:MAG: VPLPA-CTERM sorting domain-containing protein, partial [Maritimibacter sp.]